VHVIETTGRNRTEYWSGTAENRGKLPLNDVTVTFKGAEIGTGGQPALDPPLHRALPATPISKRLAQPDFFSSS
jgi:hypothetical protein